MRKILTTFVYKVREITKCKLMHQNMNHVLVHNILNVTTKFNWTGECPKENVSRNAMWILKHF